MPTVDRIIGFRSRFRKRVTSFPDAAGSHSGGKIRSRDLVKFIADTRTDAPKILRWEMVKPIAEGRQFLDLTSNRKSYLMSALRYIGKTPVYVVECYLPRAIGDRIQLEDLRTATPAELYETRLDMPPQRVVEEITVSTANTIARLEGSLEQGYLRWDRKITRNQSCHHRP